MLKFGRVKALQCAELEANRGNRLEVWVTGIGRLRTVARSTGPAHVSELRPGIRCLKG
jgi:hypothetical protein